MTLSCWQCVSGKCYDSDESDYYLWSIVGMDSRVSFHFKCTDCPYSSCFLSCLRELIPALADLLEGHL